MEFQGSVPDKNYGSVCLNYLLDLVHGPGYKPSFMYNVLEQDVKLLPTLKSKSVSLSRF